MPENLPGFDSRRYFLSPSVRLRLRSQGLAPISLLVLDALVDHDWPDRHGRRKGVVWPKVSTLARLVGVDARTVRTHLGHLIRAGLIARVGHGGRSCPAVVTLNWPRLVGENADPVVPTTAETRIRRPRAPKAVEAENQQNARGPAASALQGAPQHRAKRPAEPDGVPCPPELAAAIRALFTAPNGPPAPLRPTRAGLSPLTDRTSRESWLAQQHARAQELGLG